MSHRSWVQTPQGIRVEHSQVSCRSLAEDSPETSPCRLHSSCSRQKKKHKLKHKKKKKTSKKGTTQMKKKKHKLGKKTRQKKNKHTNEKKHTQKLTKNTHTNSKKKHKLKKKSDTGLLQLLARAWHHCCHPIPHPCGFAFVLKISNERGDSKPCGQSPMNFGSISLAARTRCPA